MSTHTRPRTPIFKKPANGAHIPEPITRVRGRSGEVAVKIKTVTYEKLSDALPEFERGLRAKTGFSVRLSPGALLDWIVEHRPEFLKP
jgi:hypothetical protein